MKETDSPSNAHSSNESQPSIPPSTEEPKVPKTQSSMRSTSHLGFLERWKLKRLLSKVESEVKKTQETFLKGEDEIRQSLLSNIQLILDNTHVEKNNEIITIDYFLDMDNDTLENNLLQLIVKFRKEI